jgi:hypothetical protein
VPVIWLLLPVNDGTFNDETTKIKAPDMANRISKRLLFSNVRLMLAAPASKKGRLITLQKAA